MHARGNARRARWLVAAVLVFGLVCSWPMVAISAAASGGTVRYDQAQEIDSTDPALAYYMPTWELEYATCLKLLNYPDANGSRGSTLVPEAATGLPRVSNDGKTYDFTVSAPWTRFSDGSPVGAASFAYAIERVLDPRMQAPGAQFVGDIVGATAKLAGEARSVSGVKVSGKHLVITLTQPTPDFLSRVAMPFFCAVPAGLPIEPTGILAPPSAGPYYIAERTPNRSILLKRNPYYKGTRPRNVDRIQYVIGNADEATRLRIEKGETDLGGFPPAAAAELGRRYGVNKGRFFVKPVLNTWYLAFNHDRPLFKQGGAHGNVALKRAINYAVDRHALAVQTGAYSGRRTDQILPPGMPGYREADLYPTIRPPNLTLAKKLAAGHTGDGHVVLYSWDLEFGPLWAQVLAFDLKQIGLDVDVRLFARTVQYSKTATRGEPFDVTIEGWAADYVDPYDFVNVLLSGTNLTETNNTNLAYFNDPLYNRRMEAASRLTGDARYRAYGGLDVDLMRNAAPWAPVYNANNRIFVSRRVGCFTYSNPYGVDLAAVCLKENA